MLHYTRLFLFLFIFCFHSTFLEEDLDYEDVYSMVREHKLYVPKKNGVKK